MGYDNLREILINTKKESCKNYISILSNGETVDDNLSYFNNSPLRKYSDLIYSTMEDIIKNNAKSYGNFEYVEFDYAFGPIYDKIEYEKNNESIDGLETAFKDIRFYSYDSRIYNNQNMIKKNAWDKGYIYNIQSTIDYDNLMSKLNREGYLVIGPSTSKELIEKIKLGEKFLVTIGINLSDKKLYEVCPKEYLENGLVNGNIEQDTMTKIESDEKTKNKVFLKKFKFNNK